MKPLKKLLRPVYRKVLDTIQYNTIQYNEKILLLLGRMMAEKVSKKGKVNFLSEVGFQIFSQFDEDGIIQYLISHLDIPKEAEIFVEFGVEDYRESNTRFLLMNNNWSGLVMDGSEENIKRIKKSYYYWKYDLIAKHAWITRENINQLIKEEGIEGEIGLLSIDIDGVDYWVWESIEVVNPIIVVIEYNAFFGIEKAVTVPYEPNFYRYNYHPTGMYFGASLKALYKLGEKKGYAFIGCSSGGVNTFFVRKDKLNEVIQPVGLHEGFVMAKHKFVYPTGEIVYGRHRWDVVREVMEKLKLVEV